MQVIKPSAHVLRKIEFRKDEKLLVASTVHPPARALNPTSTKAVSSP